MQQQSEMDLTQVMGIGMLGEVRRGPDGDLYQWTSGVDGLGNPVGFWRKIRKFAKRAHRFAKRYAPMVQRIATAIPHPAAQSLARGITTAQSAGILGVDGDIAQGPDGTYYALQGIDEVDPGVVEGLGLGSYVGEVRAGADGNLYQWVQGVDGLGNPVGFWKKIKKAWKKVKPFVSKALPVVGKVASFIPHPAAQAVARGITTASPWLKRAGVIDGIGALYEAPDGTLYHTDGVGDEVDGFGEEVEGIEDGEAEETAGIDGYVQDQAPQTRWFAGATPDTWKPLW